MKITQKILLSSLTAIALLTSGCGDSSSESEGTTFTVERGPILGATVVDANGTEARELENGQYVFDQAVAYPVTSTGGYIDVNRNGVVDAGEVKNSLKLITTEGNIVTLATTLSSNETLKTFLVSDLGIDTDSILEGLPKSDKSIEALSDTVFKYVTEHELCDPSLLTQEALEEIATDYKTRYESYKHDHLQASEHEADLINSMSIITLDDAEATSAREEIKSHFSFQGTNAQEEAETKHEEAHEEADKVATSTYETVFSTNKPHEATQEEREEQAQETHEEVHQAVTSTYETLFPSATKKEEKAEEHEEEHQEEASSEEEEKEEQKEEQAKTETPAPNEPLTESFTQGF